MYTQMINNQLMSARLRQSELETKLKEFTDKVQRNESDIIILANDISWDKLKIDCKEKQNLVFSQSIKALKEEIAKIDKEWSSKPATPALQAPAQPVVEETKQYSRP